MSSIRSFRIDSNGLRDDQEDTEFFFKINGDDGILMGTFAIAKDGLYYYKYNSHVLRDSENENTRATYNGFISFEKIRLLFESLIKIGWTLKDEDDSKIDINVKEGAIIIERNAG